MALAVEDEGAECGGVAAAGRTHAGVVDIDAVGKVVWWLGCVLAKDDWFGVLSVDEREDSSVGVDGAAKDAEVNNGSIALLSVHVAVGAAGSRGGTNAAADISASM